MAVIISRRSSYCPNFATAPFKTIPAGKHYKTKLFQVVLELTK